MILLLEISTAAAAAAADQFQLFLCSWIIGLEKPVVDTRYPELAAGSN